MNPGSTIPKAIGIAITSPHSPKQNPNVNPRIVNEKHSAQVMLYRFEVVRVTPNIPHPIGKAKTNINGAKIIARKIYKADFKNLLKKLRLTANCYPGHPNGFIGLK